MNSWTQKTFTEAIQGSSKPSCWNRRKKKKKIVYILFLCEHRNYKYFRRDFYTWTIFKVSQTEGEKENLNREIFFLAIRRERKEEIVNSQLGAYHQKNGSAWKSTSDEEWVFFNDFCFKGTPRLLKSSRMVSSMKKFVKSSQRTNESSTFSVSMSPATFWNLTSKTWRISSPDTSIARRRDFPGSLDNSSIIN